ncbi:MAG TPA: aldolase/citrate lyase family protein [Thermomicrobiales bacterium]|nr:aldolase/citrate lyase family protein [Thermomicrobiales bacterium]
MGSGNTVKDKLSAGDVVYGCFVAPPSAPDVEILALAGFDFVLIDAEHGPISPESAYPMILAAESRGIEPMARIGQNDRQVILKFLDLGVTGVMVPQVSDAESASRAITATKYWPDGLRGLAGGRTFDYGLKALAADMVPGLNSRVTTIIQFEHIDTLPHLDAILDLPDLDVLFVGPNDLAQSMGYPGQPTHPDVRKVADEVCQRVTARGIAAGTVGPTVASAKDAVDRGFRMIVANSPGFLATAARDYIAGVSG